MKQIKKAWCAALAVAALLFPAGQSFAQCCGGCCGGGILQRLFSWRPSYSYQYGGYYGRTCAAGTCTAGTCTTGTCATGTCTAGTCTAGTCTTGTCTTGTCTTGTCTTGTCTAPAGAYYPTSEERDGDATTSGSTTQRETTPTPCPCDPSCSLEEQLIQAAVDARGSALAVDANLTSWARYNSRLCVGRGVGHYAGNIRGGEITTRARSAAEALAMFRRSPAHNSILMSGHRAIGAGVAAAGGGSYYWTLRFN